IASSQLGSAPHGKVRRTVVHHRRARRRRYLVQEGGVMTTLQQPGNEVPLVDLGASYHGTVGSDNGDAHLASRRPGER
ncbi:MAG: hypothetical protein V3T28_05920, partial [Gemmatimonadales bacterium]